MKRFAVVLMLAVLGIVSALASTAWAGTAGPVYGVASIEPYAIEVSGGGVSVDTALAYTGTYSSGAHPEDLARTVTVTNVGTETCDITISGNGQPTNGSTTWTFGHDGSHGWVDEAGPNAAVWRFSPQVGKVASDFGVQQVESVAIREDHPRTLASGVPSGTSVTYDSSFEFPTQSTGSGTFEMSALVSAVAQ